MGQLTALVATFRKDLHVETRGAPGVSFGELSIGQVGVRGCRECGEVELPGHYRREDGLHLAMHKPTCR